MVLVFICSIYYYCFVSNFHPALEFMHTISDTKLFFLDINLCITNDQMSTSIHYKVIDKHSYLHLQSSHPQHCKEGLPRSQLLRLRRLIFWRGARKLSLFPFNVGTVPLLHGVILTRSSWSTMLMSSTIKTLQVESQAKFPWFLPTTL